MTSPKRAAARSSRRLPLGGLLLAMAVSHTGTRVSALAFPWFVLATTGSATQTGLVALFELAPYVIAKALGGPWIDRVGGRLVSWTTDLVSAAAAGTIPVLFLYDALSLPTFLLLVAVVGAARGPGDLAKEVMVPEAAERGGTPLVRATGLAGTVERLASTLGPAAGGLLIAAVGPIAGVAVNAVCFVLGSVVVALVLPRDLGGPQHSGPQDSRPQHSGPQDGAPQHGAPPAEAPAERYLQRLAEGFTVLRRDPLLTAIVVVVAITNLLDIAFVSVLLPVWAHDTGRGAASAGLLLTVMSAGAVVGSVLATALGPRLRRRPVFVVGFLLAGAPRFLVLALDVPAPATVVVFVVSGLGAGFINPILSAMLFERVPRRLFGRVGALADAAAWAGMPVGGVLAGLTVAAVGLGPALVAAGLLYALTTTVAGVLPQWREMDVRPELTPAGDPRARAHPGPRA